MRFVLATLAVASSLVVGWSPAVYGAGDAVRGDTLYHATYACSVCHGTPTRADPVAAGQSVEGILEGIANVAMMRSRYGQTLAQNATDLADIATYIGSVLNPQAATAAAIEYYHAEFDHYFVTDIADEISKLDGGVFAGWARSGLQFKVYSNATASAATVCRFFSTSFAPKSSHFYTPSAAECAAVKTNLNWQYEGDVFYVALAAGDGTCPAGTVAVYRLYNNGQGGAPNHRYTTDATVRDTMVAHGWVIEGNGPGFAFMCTPV